MDKSVDETLRSTLKCIETAWLVEELTKRDGVNVTRVEPYDSAYDPRGEQIDGPAIILTIID